MSSPRYIDPTNELGDLQQNGTVSCETKSETTISSGNDVTFSDTHCGIGACRSIHCVQRKCGSILQFSLVYGFAGLVTQALGLYVSSQITTLEKQFGLSSSESGIILSCNDIGFLCTVLFVSYFGPRCHIPRFLSVCIMIYGVSGLLASLPQFISGIGLPRVENVIDNNVNVTVASGLCRAGIPPNASNTIDSCTDRESASTNSVKWVVAFLGVTMVIQGVGKSPRSSLSTLYLDNNTEKTRTGFYMGIVTTMGLFGPFLGIFLGGLFGKIPVDLEETTMTPKDPRWIGAWWIGFVLFGTLGVLSSIPVYLFPRSTKTAAKYDNPGTTSIEGKDKKPIIELIKGIPQAVFRVVRCPVYVIMLLGVMCLMYAVVSGTSFGPKYLENQFNIPTWKANVILGIEKLLAGSIGTMLGGVLTSKYKMDRRKCLRMIVVMGTIAAACTGLQFMFGCENHDIIDNNGDISGDCHCQGLPYQSTCGSDGHTYYTPCHAGCQNMTDNVYGGCGRIGVDGTASPGLCDTDCVFLIPYVISSLISTLAGTMTIMPVYLTFLRSVPEEERALGMGMLSFVMSLAVFLPAPIIFGKVYDGMCLIWKEKCGVRGACALYDLVQMRYTLVGIEVVLRCCFLVLAVIASLVANKQDRPTSEDAVEGKTFNMKEVY